MELLEQKQNHLLETVSPSDFINWLSMAPTKALFLQLQLDQEELRELWSSGRFTEDEQLKAQGQSFYLLDLEAKIRGMLND